MHLSLQLDVNVVLIKSLSAKYAHFGFHQQEHFIIFGKWT